MNGHAALATLALDLPVGLADTPVEQRIGAAMADAAAAIAMGMASFARTGEISRDAKQRGGATVAEVVELQLNFTGDDGEFAAVARQQGRRVLELRHGMMLRQQLGTKVDVAFDDLIGHVLAISGKVVGVERMLRAN